jgi:quinol monooxygenase YgiN
VIQIELSIVSDPNSTERMNQALCSLMPPVQLDRGCEGSHLYADADEPNAFFYVEKWATGEDLVREIRSERFIRLLSVMESSPMPPVLEFRFVTRTRGLDYVAEVLPARTELE